MFTASETDPGHTASAPSHNLLGFQSCLVFGGSLEQNGLIFTLQENQILPQRVRVPQQVSHMHPFFKPDYRRGLTTEFQSDYPWILGRGHSTWPGVHAQRFRCTDVSLLVLIPLYRPDHCPNSALPEPNRQPLSPKLQTYSSIDMQLAHPISLLKSKLNSHLFVLVF